METVRPGIYIHGDSVTAHKGCALSLVRGPETFAALAARMAYAASSDDWKDVHALFPQAEDSRVMAGAEVDVLRLLRIEPGEAGRIEAVSDGARAAAAKIVCQTDFGARTPEFVLFCQAVAAAALRHAERQWGTLVACEPDLAVRKAALGSALREQVEVAAVALVGTD